MTVVEGDAGGNGTVPGSKGAYCATASTWASWPLRCIVMSVPGDPK